MDFVLDEEVDQWDQGTKEATCEYLPILDCGRIIRAQGEASQGPGKSRDEVGDHEDVVPVMVIRRRDIRPTTTGDGAKYPSPSSIFRE